MKYLKVKKLLERAKTIPTVEFMERTNREDIKEGRQQSYHFLFFELQATEQELKEVLDICDNAKSN